MSDDGSPERTWTVDELAAHFNVSPRTISRWKANGALPFVQPGGPGSALRFGHDALTAGSTQAASSPEREPTSADPPVADPRAPRNATRLAGRQPRWMQGPTS
jgi:excisionase family DNA binding protein